MNIWLTATHHLWESIEGAPRDGRWIMVCNSYAGPVKVRFDKDHVNEATAKVACANGDPLPEELRGGWLSHDGSFYWYDFMPHGPTHWTNIQ